MRRGRKASRGSGGTDLRRLAVVAAVAAATFAVALAWREITSLDLGYHLAYGAVLLDEGRIVDDATFVVPPPTAEEARGDLPPGCRFEADGRLTFANANWLSQGIMVLAYRADGSRGLVMLTVVLVAAILAGQAAVLRRMTGSLLWIGPVWLATALTGWERLYLRPELFGNVCLVAQLALVAAPLTRRRIAAFLGLQVLAVNVHSYWVLGVALLAAAAAEPLILARLPRRWGGAARSPIRVPAGLLAGSVVATVLLGAAHPAGTRSLELPIATLAYMKEHRIGGRTQEQVQELWREGKGHPWHDTAELLHSLSPNQWGRRATHAFVALLTLAVPAAGVLLWRGRPGLAAVVVLLALAGLPMRRNIATSGFIVWPLVAGAGVLWARQAGGALRRRGGIVAGAALALSAAAALYWTQGVVVGRFYRPESDTARFGADFSRLVLPIDTCRWLDERLDRTQPVFANFNASSSVLFFASRVSGVSILTNSWAAPPARRTLLQAMQSGRARIDPFAAEAGLDVAVLYAQPSNGPLVSSLASSPDWALVHLEGSYVVFARRTAGNSRLLEEELTPETLDIADLLERMRRLDSRGEGLRRAAGTLIALGWTGHAQRAAVAWERVSGRGNGAGAGESRGR